MYFFSKKLIAKIILIISFFLTSQLYADNHNIYEILEQLQKDIKTLEKAVYSNSAELNVTVGADAYPEPFSVMVTLTTPSF